MENVYFLKLTTKSTFDIKKLILLLFIPIVFTFSNCENNKEITIEEIEKNQSKYNNQHKLYTSSINEDDSFFGHWESDDSSYFLTINDKGFVSYKFTAYENEKGYLSWKRVSSPGMEVFVKKEDNIIVTNYWIDEKEYYVKVYYTLIDDNNMKAEFNGKLKGDFYHKVVNYKKLSSSTLKSGFFSLKSK